MIDNCPSCGHDLEREAPLRSVWVDRRKEGGCLACPHDHQPEKVWLVTIGQTIVRLCKRHMKMLHRMTR